MSDSVSPIAFVLYGATGDLAKRLVLPGLYNLATNDLLPTKWRLIGNGRGDVSHEEFRDRIKAALEEFGPKPEGDTWKNFAERCYFAGQGFSEDDPGTLLEVLKEKAGEMGDCQLVHYFALPPTQFEGYTKAVKAHDLVSGSRVVYEKPYGTSPDSFRALDELVQSIFDEDQVYRIDHFLGKEASQQLHGMRFANTLLASAWSNEFVESVQIDIPETLDIKDRADFYDHTGAFLDMIVTHLFQLVAEVTMEPPASLDADALQDARESAMADFRALTADDVVLGQFEGYRETDGVADDSTTDTFAAARLFVDSDRWRDVPFLLRTGKKLAVGRQTVSLVFRAPDGPVNGVAPAQNVLTFDLSGTGKISLSLVVNTPGVEDTTSTLVLENALESVGGQPLTAYARLIHDVVAGDRGLFTRPDGLQHAWKAVSAVLDNRPEALPYAAGSWGPKEASGLAAPHGWILGQE